MEQTGREKYTNMADHDLLVEHAVKLEYVGDQVATMADTVTDHEKRLTTQETICRQARATVPGDNPGNPGNPSKRRHIDLEKRWSLTSLTIGGVLAVAAVIYTLGDLVGWWA